MATQTTWPTPPRILLTSAGGQTPKRVGGVGVGPAREREGEKERTKEEDTGQCLMESETDETCVTEHHEDFGVQFVYWPAT